MKETHNAVRPKERFLVFGAPLIDEAEIREVVATLRSGWLGTGPRVARFEEEFRRYNGSPQAIAVNSCTAALHLSMIAAGISPGDEVITTAMTFCASVNAIIHARGKPVLADCLADTMNIDPAQVERRITSRTKAILVVHFAGRPCDMDAIWDIAQRNRLKIIEDCAHAIEAEYQGQKVGTLGDFGCFSFYVTKNVVTGEGGMVTTRREEDAARIKTLALHGMSKDAWKRFGDEGYKHYYIVEAGFKYNMMDLQAAIGLHQLERVEQNLVRRAEIWGMYDEAFRELPVKTPEPGEPWSRHARHLYTVRIDVEAGIERDEFLDAMTRHHVGVGVHYLSIPEHPFYRRTYGWRPEDYPNAMHIGRETVSLPLSARLSDEDVEDVVQAVRQVLEGSN